MTRGGWSVIRGSLFTGLALAMLIGHAAGAADRPRVGLVLGGGGARGAAHIGVLEVLREQNIPVDCVAGTSMGALVSGAFAAGLNPDDMLKALDQADWRNMFEDSPDASRMNPRRKEVAKRFLPGSELGISERGVQTLPGVVDGQKIKLFFNRLVRSHYGDPQIENLRLLVSIVATDLVSGDKVAFRQGGLTQAMRASMSVPGVMAPVTEAGRQLVDGGLVDNVPIDEVRTLCQPDVVIAVNVGSPMLKAEEIGGAMSVTAQMVNLLTEQNVSRSLKTLGARDIYIKPDLGPLTAGDFDKYREAAQAGRQAAEAALPKLQALRVDGAQYAAWWANVAQFGATPPRIDAVEVAPMKNIPEAVVAQRLGSYIGQSLEPQELERDMMGIYGDGDFQGVDYSLLSVRDKNTLRVVPMEKPWGPDYVRFGLNIDSSLGEYATYNVRTAYHKTWINSLGAEWLGGLQVGNEPHLFTEFYQPLDARQRVFIEPKLSLRRERVDLYQDNDRLAEYKVDELRLDLMAGINVGTVGPVSAGWVTRKRMADVDVGVPQWSSEDKRFSGWMTAVNFEQFDRLYVPNRGWSAKGSYFNSPEENYSKAELELRAAYRVNDYVFHGRLYAAGSPSGQLPTFDPVALGGFLNMSGFAKNQIIGDSVRYGGVRVEKIIGQLPIGLRGNMRVGLALETGKVGGRYTETELGGRQKSLAIYLGGETPIGPAYIGYGYSPEGMSNIFLFIGTP